MIMRFVQKVAKGIEHGQILKCRAATVGPYQDATGSAPPYAVFFSDGSERYFHRPIEAAATWAVTLENEVRLRNGRE